MSDKGNDSDRIHIEGLELLAHIGVPENECVSEQRLIINITYWPEPSKQALEDDVSRTVDYAAVCDEVKRFVQGRSDRLIETLADAVAMRLLELFAIEKITIELRKFILPEVEFVLSLLAARRWIGRMSNVCLDTTPSAYATHQPTRKLVKTSPPKSRIPLAETT